MKRKHSTQLGRRSLSKRTLRWLALLLLAALVPTTGHSGQVAGLTIFVNGQLADADEVNANFAIVKAAIDDNDARIGTLENLLDSVCPAGRFITGISVGSTLVCSP